MDREHFSFDFTTQDKTNSFSFSAEINENSVISTVQINEPDNFGNLYVNDEYVCRFSLNDEYLANFIDDDRDIGEFWDEFKARLAESAGNLRENYLDVFQKLSDIIEEMPLGDPLSCALKAAIISSVSEIANCYIQNREEHTQRGFSTIESLVNCTKFRAKQIMARFMWKTLRCIFA